MTKGIVRRCRVRAAAPSIIAQFDSQPSIEQVRNALDADLPAARTTVVQSYGDPSAAPGDDPGAASRARSKAGR